MTIARLLIVAGGVATVLGAGDAHGRPRLSGAGWMHYELHGLYELETDAAADRPRGLVLAGARIGGMVGKTIGPFLGLDLAAGSTVGGAGFAYDVALLPLGVGVRLGKTGMLALGAGVAASGAVGTLDDAVALPLELTAELSGGPIRVLLRARASWVGAADARQDGAPSTTLADELDATLAVRLGRRYEAFGFPSGNGYFVGVSYRELAGARFAGLVIGYSIDAATPRRW